MPEYTFNKPGVTKLFVLDAQMRAICPVFDYCNYNDPELIVVTLQEIDADMLTTLQVHIDQYVDPLVYLELQSTDSSTAPSSWTSSPTLTSVLVWIMLGSTQTELSGILNAIKTVLTVRVDDITQLIGNSTGTVSLVLYSITRNLALVTREIDISEQLGLWETAANNNETGSKVLHKSIMFEGLRHSTCDYDNICEWQLAVSNPNVKVNLNGLQSLYYRIL